MRLSTILIPLALTTACSLPEPDRPIVGEISFATNTYPIRAASADGTVWQVMIDGLPVTCRKATQDDCYWSLRNYLAAQEALDDLPIEIVQRNVRHPSGAHCV